MTWPYRRHPRVQKIAPTPKHKMGTCLAPGCGKDLPPEKRLFCDRECTKAWRAHFFDPFSKENKRLHIKGKKPPLVLEEPVLAEAE